MNGLEMRRERESSLMISTIWEVMKWILVAGRVLSELWIG